MKTASNEMIKNFKALREQGVDWFICTTYTSKKRYAPVLRKTAQGVSSYANAMYRKYGDDVAVEVGYFDNDMNWHLYTTYQA